MKNKDIIGLSDKDLLSTLKDEREAYLKMKFTHSVSQVESTARIPATRKKIARLLTEQKSRLIKSKKG